MRLNMPVPRGAETLLRECTETARGTILHFEGCEGFDVYNPSVPFAWEGKTVMAARVQRRDGSVSSALLFERVSTDRYVLLPDVPTFEGMEDPFVTVIAGETVLGGTHALWDERGELITYRAEFWRLNGRNVPELLFCGPDRMKDIRLLELTDGRIAVFTRPQGEAMAAYGRTAAIGFFIADDLSDINAEKIAAAPLLEWHFLPEEWGGVNQALPLGDGRIGLIGHIARGEHVGGEHVLHYYSTAQAVDLESGCVSPLRIIARRELWPDAPSREPRLKDVCFTAGIVREPNGSAVLYTGLSDAACGCMEIKDPFAV